MASIPDNAASSIDHAPFAVELGHHAVEFLRVLFIKAWDQFFDNLQSNPGPLFVTMATISIAFLVFWVQKQKLRHEIELAKEARERAARAVFRIAPFVEAEMSSEADCDGVLMLEISNRDQRPVTVKGIYCSDQPSSKSRKVHVIDIDTQYGRSRSVCLDSSECCTFKINFDPALMQPSFNVCHRMLLVAKLCVVIRLTTGESFTHRLPLECRRAVANHYFAVKAYRVLCRTAAGLWSSGALKETKDFQSSRSVVFDAIMWIFLVLLALGFVVR